MQSRTLSPLAILFLLAAVLPGCTRAPLIEPGGAAEVPDDSRRIRPPKSPPSPRRSAESTEINVRVNQDESGGDQNETVMAVNPDDPLNLVAGANDFRTGSVKTGFYASLDGGQSWVDGVIPSFDYFFQADPAVAFCGDGSAIFTQISYDGIYQPHGMFFSRSTDGGLTWSTATAIVDRPGGEPFTDKEWVACDTTGSPYNDRIYVTWTDASQTDGFKIMSTFSRDSGASWSQPNQVSDGSNTQASVVAVGPDGEVYVTWEDSSFTRLGFDRSTNGGRTFGPDSFPSDMVAIPQDPDFRRFSFPTMDADRSDGPHRGNVYIAWPDNRFGEPDILFTRSTDGGDSWSPPIRVNDDPPGTGDQWFPWMTVDPEGRVIVTFFDRRRAGVGAAYEIWGAISRDGGQSFDTNFLISEVASDAAISDFIGDYSGLAATSDRLYPIWTDLRAGTGESDIYTDRFPNTFAYDEVDGVGFEDATTLVFETQDERFAEDLQYDVVSGLLSELAADGGYERASCLSAGQETPPLFDSRVPPAGDGYYHLVRARGSGGVGTYGDGTAARPNVRDPLDESLATCP